MSWDWTIAIVRAPNEGELARLKADPEQEADWNRNGTTLHLPEEFPNDAIPEALEKVARPVSMPIWVPDWDKVRAAYGIPEGASLVRLRDSFQWWETADGSTIRIEVPWSDLSAGGMFASGVEVDYWAVDQTVLWEAHGGRAARALAERLDPGSWRHWEVISPLRAHGITLSVPADLPLADGELLVLDGAC